MYGQRARSANIMVDSKFLNRFYIDTRYPVHWPTQYTKEEASKVKKAAEHIRDMIKGTLKSFEGINYGPNSN